MYLALLVIISISFAIITWRDLRFALILLAGLLPTYLLRFSIGPLPSTLLEVLILISAVVWLVKYNAWRIDIRRFDAWSRAGVLLLAAASFGVVIAPDTISAFGIWKAYFVEAFLVFLMMRAVFKQDDWYKALVAVSITGVAASLFAIFQFATGLAIPVPWDIERRVTGIFDYPNALGLFLAPIVTMNLVFAHAKEGREQLFWASAAMLGLIAILLAETEAAIVAIPAALIITTLFTLKTKQKKLAVAGFGVLLLVIALLIPFSRSKLLLQDYSGQVRLSQWSETVQMLSKNPAFGAGLNAYPTVLEPHHDPTLYEIFQYPHNIFLNIWSELGLLGLLAFFWLAWLILKEARAISNTSILHHSNTLKLAALAALLTMTIHGLVDVPYFKNDLSVLTWILIAIMATRFDKTKPAR